MYMGNQCHKQSMSFCNFLSKIYIRLKQLRISIILRQLITNVSFQQVDKVDKSKKNKTEIEHKPIDRFNFYCLYIFWERKVKKS